MNLLIFIGNEVSRQLTSVEKRDTIRPLGVVSKKSIGAPNIRCNMVWCKCNAARITPYTKLVWDMKIDTTSEAEKIFFAKFLEI